MTLGVIGKKVGMTQIFDSEGLAVPVTVIQVGKTVVTQVKTVDTKDYPPNRDDTAGQETRMKYAT